ncbi:DUF6240 domain-containing protein [Cellulosilyticum ruminicola]|uniref:DUF6240 domain-containing protein n=1 Tax=Cellulosilyticum ruminicola TaxID=425254 RepID=UPI0006CFE76C|nr:DUF6240 domain-containing protein [Cellulosilyticum ruminicola]
MIDAVKQGVCSVYGNYNVNNTAENINNIKSHQVNKFDIKELLADIQGCTYNEEDVNAVDEKLMERLREKFDLEKEDVYKLKNKGFDLEMLYVEDYSGYMKDSKKKSSKSVSEDDKESLKHKIETIKTGSDNMYLSALVSQKDITINSLYESNFKGNYKKNGITFKDADIDNVLNMNKLENNEQNTWAAKLLLSHGMDVNAENVMKLDNIQTIVDSLDDFIENEKRIEELAGGKAIGDHLLLKDGKIVYDYEGIKSLKKDLGQVTEEDIKEVLEEDKTVSIKNLKEVMHKNTQLALNGNAKTNVIRGIVTLQDVEAVKTQINQIRAKLTVEAAQKISEKMPLESSSLSNVVEEMLVVENAKIEEALKAVDLEATAENKEMLQDVLETKVLMMDSLSYTIHLEVESDGNITLERINGALKAYGENESVAETRFGESIKIVENQIEKLLQNQGIEATEKTIAAAKALITNNLEVTPEQIEQVLEITTKMDAFIEDLTPALVAEFIKEGLNPYKATVDSVLEWMSTQKIQALKGSVAESIVALEEQSLLNDSQKEALLGLYRILQAVEMDREEIVGYLYKNNLPLTVEHLQEATKYISSKNKTNHVEVTVDDNFGEVSSREEARTAKTMLEKGYAQNNKAVSVVQLIEGMELDFGDNYENKLQKINAFLYPFIKEQFKNHMGQFDGMSTLPESFLDKLEYIKTANPEVVENMMQNNIPLTVSNIYWMNKMNEEPNLYGELLREHNLLREELQEHLEELEEELEALEAKAKAGKELAITTGDMKAYRNYKQMEEVVHTQNNSLKKMVFIRFHLQ